MIILVACMEECSMCVCVCALLRACVRACVRVCVEFTSLLLLSPDVVISNWLILMSF